jgi:alpha-glucosidase (family GH31 glycosyl hydrolase)
MLRRLIPEHGKALNHDRFAKDPIPFDITDRSFLEAFFSALYRPFENDGPDFWWVDWQQGEYSRLPEIDPFWMLNHYYFLDNSRDGKRPLTFSRHAGPGSHRYPVGFSGDMIVT